MKTRVESFTSCALSRRFAAELYSCLDFVVNCIEVMAVQRPQICCDECTAVTFTQLLRMASLQTHFCWLT